MIWNIKFTIKAETNQERRQEIIKNILKNRGFTTKKQIRAFLSPPKPTSLTLKQLDINSNQFRLAISRIKKAIKNKEQIIIYGDYDADGICATALLWETLYLLGAKVVPFIPSRDKHGYGISISGIEDILKGQIPGTDLQIKKPDLIITVDNGLVAHEAAKFIKKNKIDLIITDHHTPPKKLPSALALIHTTQLSGSGVAWILACELSKSKPALAKNTLDLATIGTVADLVPLTGANRSLVKWGLKSLQKTKRVGLQTLFKHAAIDPHELAPHHISFIIAPRLNAMGRLKHALDSVRILVTNKKLRANQLALTLSQTNLERQNLTNQLLKQAKSLVTKPKNQKLLIIDHQDFHEGVIGLIAGKLVEEYSRPSIVICRGKTISKASARSISGINIIETIRTVESLLINAGGHPMAAGFTIQSSKIKDFKKAIINHANEFITDDMLQPILSIDCQISIKDLSWLLYKQLQKLSPFGIGNPRPTFAIKNTNLINKMTVGKNKAHLKLLLPSTLKNQTTISALWFKRGDVVDNIQDTTSIAATIDENTWNGKSELQLKIKDLQ